MKTPSPNEMYGRERGDIGVSSEASAAWFVNKIKLAYAAQRQLWEKGFEAEVKLYEHIGGEDAAKEQFREPDFMTDEELEDLLKPVEQFEQSERPYVLSIHNDAVRALRFQLEKELKLGVPRLKVNEGLTVPVDWDAHYTNLYKNPLPFTIFAAVQHAFRGNPLEGETVAWTNQRGFFGQRRSVSSGIAGAAVIGAAAAWLLGS